MKSISRTKTISILGLFLFAGVGAYLVFGAKAGPFDTFFTPPNSISVNQEARNNFWPPNGSDTPMPAGIDFNLTLRVGPDNESSQAGHYILYFGSHDAYIQYKGYTCGSFLACKPAPWSSTLNGTNSPDFILCFDIPGNYDNHTLTHLLTVHLNSNQTIPQINSLRNGMITMRHGAGAGSCQSSRGPHDVTWYYEEGMDAYPHRSVSGLTSEGIGHCGSGGSVFITCDLGVSSGGGGGGGGSGGEGAGGGQGGGGSGSFGSAGAGGSAGSTGSSAKKQGNQSNIIPSSSNQGDNDTPELDPSPFYDGKAYQPGSDPDNFKNVASTTGKKLIRNWYLILGVLILGGVAGYGYWKWHQKKQKRL